MVASMFSSLVIPDGPQGRSGTQSWCARTLGPGSPLRSGRDDGMSMGR